jgi:hypothetical protein
MLFKLKVTPMLLLYHAKADPHNFHRKINNGIIGNCGEVITKENSVIFMQLYIQLDSRKEE